MGNSVLEPWVLCHSGQALGLEEAISVWVSPTKPASDKDLGARSLFGDGPGMGKGDGEGRLGGLVL